MADPNILMGIKTAQFMNPLDAAAQAAQVKRANLQNAMFQQETDTQTKLDKAYQLAGGDVSKMQDDPSIGYKAGMEIGALKSQQAQNAFKAQNEKLDYLLKESEYSAQQASGVRDQAGWDQVRNHVLQTLGPDAAAHMPEQFSEQAKQQLIDGAMSFKDRIAQQRADQQATQQDRMYNATMERIAASERNAAARGDGGGKPQNKIWDATRGVFVDPNTGTFSAPVGQDGGQLPTKPVVKGGTQNLSATAQKELFEAEDMVMAGENVKSAIESALALNDKAYSGYGADTRAAIRSNLPGQSEGADATVQMNNIILGQALESLKATFGSSPTEGERAILVQLQASVDKTPQQRADILQKAKELADKRINFNKQKASQLRSGEYMSAGGGSSAQEQETPPPSGGFDPSSFHR